MMNIQTICLPSGSYCSLFLITQMGISSVALELQFGVVLQLELRRLVAQNPKRADFNETSVFRRQFFSNHREKKEQKTLHTSFTI